MLRQITLEGKHVSGVLDIVFRVWEASQAPTLLAVIDYGLLMRGFLPLKGTENTERLWLHP